VTGFCTRCRSFSRRLEADHPDGRIRGTRRRRAAIPVYPTAVIRLCPDCHLGRGIVDRGAGCEGASWASVWLLIRRRAAWAGWFALADHPITLESEHLADLARVLDDVVRTVAICSSVLSGLAEELHRRGADDLGAVVDGVTLLLGGPR
jgi:hypothetical protein